MCVVMVLYVGGLRWFLLACQLLHIRSAVYEAFIKHDFHPERAEITKGQLAAAGSSTLSKGVVLGHGRHAVC